MVEAASAVGLVAVVTGAVETEAGAGAVEAAEGGRMRRRNGSHAQSLAAWYSRWVAK